MTVANGRGGIPARDRRSRDDGDPSPLRPLEEGEVLRRTEKGVVVEAWRVPPTLRLDPLALRVIRRGE